MMNNATKPAQPDWFRSSLTTALRYHAAMTGSIFAPTMKIERITSAGGYWINVAIDDGKTITNRTLGKVYKNAAAARKAIDRAIEQYREILDETRKSAQLTVSASRFTASS